MTSGDRLRRRSGSILLLVVALLALVAAACGDDDVADPETQPAPGVTVFAQGDFGDIPLVPDSRNIGDREELDGTVTESFLVADVPPDEVIDFYGEALDDWTMLGPVESTGPDAVKAEWQFRDRILTVSAALAPTGGQAIEGQTDLVTQYSLHLHGEDEL